MLPQPPTPVGLGPLVGEWQGQLPYTGYRDAALQNRKMVRDGTEHFFERDAIELASLEHLRLALDKGPLARAKGRPCPVSLRLVQ